MLQVLISIFSFQEWFDFSVVSEDGGDEKLIAQEQEDHVLETLHAVSSVKCLIFWTSTP